MSRPAHLELSRYLLSVDPIIAECHFHVKPAVCRDCSAFPHELFQSPVGIVLRAAFIHSRNAVAEVNPFKRLTGQPLPDIALAHFSHFVPPSASAGIAMLGDMRSLAATAKCLAICSISSKVKGDLFSKRRLSVDKGIFVAPASASMLSRREPSSARIFDTASLLRLK